MTVDDAVEIVEIVEENLLRLSAVRPVYRDPRIMDPLAIRSKDQVQIVNELSRVAEIIAAKHPPLGSCAEVLMKSLYVWYGCLCIDKVCRVHDIHGVGPQNRMEVHDQLVKEAEANTRIRKGFVSRYFRRSRINRN
jgi:hypothetical protein